MLLAHEPVMAAWFAKPVLTSPSTGFAKPVAAGIEVVVGPLTVRSLALGELSKGKGEDHS